MSPPYPETDAPHVVEALFELGPLRDGNPLQMSECLAFATVVHLTEWEVRIMYQMSRAYADEAVTARSPFAIPPLERKDEDG